MQVNLVVLVMAIRIVVRRARYKAKQNEKNTALSFQVEIRWAFMFSPQWFLLIFDGSVEIDILNMKPS